MRVLISISHPAWAHQFHNIIKLLEQKGHSVKVLVIKKDRDWERFESRSKRHISSLELVCNHHLMDKTTFLHSLPVYE